MVTVVVAVITLTLGIIIGLIVNHIRLHWHSNGMIIFDRSDENAYPYLCFESYDELAEIRKRKYVTMVVGWSKDTTRR